MARKLALILTCHCKSLWTLWIGIRLKKMVGKAASVLCNPFVNWHKLTTQSTAVHGGTTAEVPYRERFGTLPARNRQHHIAHYSTTGMEAPKLKPRQNHKEHKTPPWFEHIWTLVVLPCFTMFYHVLPWFTPSPLHNVTLGKDGKGDGVTRAYGCRP